MTISVRGASGAKSFAEATRISHNWQEVNTALNASFTLAQTGNWINGDPWSNSGIAAAYAAVDGRGVRIVRPSLAQGVLTTWRPGAVDIPVLFRQTFANAGAGPVEPSGGTPDLCFNIAAWLKKVNAVDQTSARMFFGILNDNSTPLGATAIASRTGLIGDGVTGFGFGSVNCPDGAAAGANAHNARDVNFVQPQVLVDPSTKWFHVRVKAMPATPELGGRIACYLNGRLVALFDAVANLPRGNSNVSNSYRVLHGCCMADFDGAIQIVGFHMYQAESWYDKDVNP